MKKYFVILALLIIYLFYKNTNVTYIPSESIRFRIIPHSNNIEDIFIKEQVLENISKEITGHETKTIEEARYLLNTKLENIDEIVDKTLKEHEYKKSYNINYGLNYFPSKTYNNQTYQEGYYESLVIKLGEGNGDNFWCVLFPPLCLLEVEETKKESVEYSFILKDIFNKIFK